LGSASDLLWVAGMTIGLTFTLIAAFLFPFPNSVSGRFWAYFGLLVRSSFYLWSGDRLRGRGGETLSRLFKMGLVAGLFELLIDWVLIHGVLNGRLDYLSHNDVVLLGSPIWMPVAWACVIVELGYPCVRLFGLWREKMGIPKAAVVSSIIIAVSAGFTVGLYEYFANKAGWWRYAAAHAMIGRYCALFIPIGEVLMFIPVLPIAAGVISDDDHPTAAALENGALFALSIAVGYAVAYGLLEFGRVPRY
jgi:hypothetical protein